MSAAPNKIIREEADFIVVGSGVAGSTAARWLANSGASVLVLEEGGWPEPAGPDLRPALESLYRDGGMRVASGQDGIVLLQGRCVGGSSVVSTGVQSPMPEEAWEQWCDLEPAWRTRLPFSELELAREEHDQFLQVTKTPSSLAGVAGQMMRAAFPGRADATWRSAPGCRGAGQCLLGCPNKVMASADRSLLVQAQSRGAQVLSGCKVTKIIIVSGTAQGVEAVYPDGRKLSLSARRGVFLAAGAIQSSWLLLRSGVRPTGHGFQLQPLLVVAGLGAPDAGARAGASTSSHVLRSLGADLLASVLPERARASYLPGIGLDLEERLQRIQEVVTWNVVFKPTARGKVTDSFGQPKVSYALNPADQQRILQAVALASEGMLRAGAAEIYPQVRLGPAVITDHAGLQALREVRAGPAVAPMRSMHFFGGLHVDDRFQVPGIRKLVLADSAAFPSAIGVGPQSAIGAYATAVTQRWV